MRRGPPLAVREALEQPDAFDLGDHRLRFGARDRSASQGHIVVDLDHHAATNEQQHRCQLRVAIDANDDFHTFFYHLCTDTPVTYWFECERSCGIVIPGLDLA
jgi:hypothetical protein